MKAGELISNKVFENPIKTSDFVPEILEYYKVKYSPFDKDGNEKLGYLYELNRELARVLLCAAIRSNPNLSDVDYVHEHISEKEE